MRTGHPLLVVFCGPNGAGKSTLRRIALADLSIPFVNADDIAIAEFGPAEAAARAYEAAAIAAAAWFELFAARQSFAFETVLSDPHGAKIQFLRQARDSGYFVVAHFIGLESPELSRARVIQRVHSGGHDVPDEKLAARYPRVIANLRRMLDVPDELIIYDNSSAEIPFRRIAKLARGKLVEVSASLPAWVSGIDLLFRQTAKTVLLR